MSLIRFLINFDQIGPFFSNFSTKNRSSYDFHSRKGYDNHFFDKQVLAAIQKVFQVILKICPKFFLFFFQPQIEFSTQTNIFRKKKFCMQNLIFCVHNGYDNISFFLSKALKIPISFVWRVYVRPDQCPII